MESRLQDVGHLSCGDQGNDKVVHLVAGVPLLCVLVGGPQDNEGIKVWVTFSKIRKDVHYFVK